MAKQALAPRRKDIRLLREALLDLTGVLNRPQPDAAVIKSAGVNLDRALFPLLMRIEGRGSVGVVELAELAGRDYTTVSRQVAKLEELGLVRRSAGKEDRRVTAVAITAKGRVITDALGRAREKIVLELLVDWKERDVNHLAQLLRKLADRAMHWTATKTGHTAIP